MTTDYAAIVRNFTDEAVANARTTTAVRDGAGNLRSLTDAASDSCRSRPAHSPGGGERDAARAPSARPHAEPEDT
jgi:hypothetical protein